MVIAKAIVNFSPPSLTPQRVMSRDRSESGQSVITNLSSLKDDTPLYYCDKDAVSRTTTITRRAERALYAALVLTVFFIIVEVVGGYIANSLAIMTDAGHMASDLTSFFFSIVAIKLAKKTPTKRLSFGFHRAEVLGALASVLLIWLLTGILVYMAAMRIISNDYDVDGTVMLITAGVSIVFNLIMGTVLHLGQAGHTHFGMSHVQSHDDDIQNDKEACNGHGHDSNNNQSSTQIRGKTNINVRAAFIHVLGDLVQSIGVLTAALIIKFTGWELADPLCTFVFSVLVLVTTVTVLRDIILVLMEAAPRHIDIDALSLDLCSIEGVRDAHSLRVWSLTMDKAAISVHLDIEKDSDSNHIVHEANERLRIKYGINYITVQVQCACSRSVSVQTFVPLSISSDLNKPNDLV